MESIQQTTIIEVAPLLRWAGSKRQLVPKLISYWNKRLFTSYIEPFAGAAHLFFSINSISSVINDMNPELMNMYKVVKEKPEALYNELMSMPVDKSYYYNIRALDIRKLTSYERAVRFLYLNRYCFNGLYRTDQKGNFNVPFSPTKAGTFPSIDKWMAVSDKLKNTEIICHDFETVVKKYATKDSFIYLDPPYLTNKKSFTEYGSLSFNQEDVNRLINTIKYIDRIGAYFVLSYSDYEPVVEALSEWGLEKVSLKRTISCITKNRNSVDEILATNII